MSNPPPHHIPVCPVTFKWDQGGRDVSVVGSFSNWQPVPLQRQAHAFERTLLLPPGTFLYKFIVDGVALHLANRPHGLHNGQVVNVLQLQPPPHLQHQAHQQHQHQQAQQQQPHQQAQQQQPHQHQRAQAQPQPPMSAPKEDSDFQMVERHQITLTVSAITTCGALLSWERPPFFSGPLVVQIAGDDAERVVGKVAPQLLNQSKGKQGKGRKGKRAKGIAQEDHTDEEDRAFFTIAELPKTDFALTQLKAGCTYRVRVQSADKSVLSDPQRLTTLPPTPPELPGPLLIVGARKTDVTVSWGASPWNGMPLTGYQVLVADYVDEKGEDANVAGQCPEDDGWRLVYEGDKSKTKIGKLSPATKYRVRVRAVNEVGKGGFGESIVVQTQGSAPSAPSMFVFTALKPGELKVEWVVESDGGSEVAFNRLEMDKGEGFEVVHNAPESSAVISGLPNNVTVRVRANASNANGTSAWSEVVEATTSAVVPDRPSEVGVRTTRKNDADLTFVVLSDGGKPITAVVAKVMGFTDASPDPPADKRSPALPSQLISTPLPIPLEASLLGNTETFAVTGLLPGREYTVQLAVVNAVGHSDFSESVVFTTRPSTPSRPLAPTVKSISGTSVTLAWPAAHGNGDPAVQYQLERVEEAQGGKLTVLDAVSCGDQLQATMSCERGGVVVSYRVVAANSLGFAPPSPVTEFESPAQPPEPPEVTCQATDRGLSLKWKEPWHNGSRLEDYVVWAAVAKEHRQSRPAAKRRGKAEAAGNDGEGQGEEHDEDEDEEDDAGYDPRKHVPRAGQLSLQRVATVKAPATTHLLKDVGPIQWYCVAVSATNAVGESQPSQRVMCCTLPVSPDAPTSLKATEVLCNSARLRWEVPDCHGDPITQYVARVGVSAAKSRKLTWSEGYSGANPECELSSLQPGTRYTVRVQAVNAKGSSIASEPLHFTTASTVPAAPPPPSVVTVHPTAAKLKWDEPRDDGGAPVTSYVLRIAEGTEEETAPGERTRGEIAFEGVGLTTRLTKLEAGKRYFANVAARNSAGESAVSEWVVIDTPRLQPPATPAITQCAVGKTSKTMQGDTFGHLSLKWTQAHHTTNPASTYTVLLNGQAVYKGPGTKHAATIKIRWDAGCEHTPHELALFGTNATGNAVPASIRVPCPGEALRGGGKERRKHSEGDDAKSGGANDDGGAESSVGGVPKRLQKRWRVNYRLVESVAVCAVLLFLVYVALALR